MSSSVRSRIYKILAILALGIPSISFADAVDRVNSEPHAVYVDPDKAVCIEGSAFDVRLGEPSNASSVKILETGVPWIGKSIVTEFQPTQPYPPFSKFFYLKTILSQRVSWSLGAAFYESDSMAREAAAKMANWYAQKLQAPIKSGYVDDMYLISLKGYTLAVWARGKSVRVSCEHFATSSLAIKEAMEAAGAQ